MRKVFSVIELETNTGIRDAGLMGGIPKMEKIQKSKLFKELVDDCGCTEYITVDVKSYSYDKDEYREITLMQIKSFAFLYPDQCIKMRI